MFKKLLQVYCDWSVNCKALVPDKADSAPKAGLTDPIDILSNMENMIKISTNEKLQVIFFKIYSKK